MALCVVNIDATCFLGATSGLYTCHDGLDMSRLDAASAPRWRFASSLEMLRAVVVPPRCLFRAFLLPQAGCMCVMTGWICPAMVLLRCHCGDMWGRSAR
mgnify:CR=1 FL=1